jgi:hypothetical protein
MPWQLVCQMIPPYAAFESEAVVASIRTESRRFAGPASGLLEFN